MAQSKIHNESHLRAVGEYLQDTPNSKKKPSKRRIQARRAGALVVGTAVAVTGVLAMGRQSDKAADKVMAEAGSALTRQPNSDAYAFTVQPNDNLSQLVHEAYPHLKPYSDEFNAKVDELQAQLPLDDQYMGTLTTDPREVLEFPHDADMQNLRRDEDERR